MILKQVDNVIRQINDFHEILLSIEKMNGSNIYISSIGDRKSIVKFKSLQCFLTDNGAERCLLMIEDVENEEDCQEIYLNPKNIERIDVLEWDESDTLEGFYVVVKMKTGNELHFTKCVA